MIDNKHITNHEKDKSNELPPSDWQFTKLGDITELRKQPVSPDEVKNVRYVGLEHLESGNPRLCFWDNASKVKSTKSIFCPGDILYGKLRPYLDKAVLAEWEGICSTDILVLKPSKKIIPEYLAYHLHIKPFVRHAISTTSGTNHPRTSWGALSEYIFYLPSIYEQYQIVYILSTIQQAIEATDKVIIAAQELKKSLMQHLFTYGPVSLEEAEQVPLKETEVGMVPEYWEVISLEELVFKSFSGGTPTTKKPEYWDGTINWTTSAYIEGLYLDKAPKKISKIGLENSSSKIVPKNNIIVGTRVGVGKIAINNIDVAISQDLTGLIIDKSKVELDYLAYALLTENIQDKFTSQTRGTTIKGIPRKDLMKIPVHIPSLQEQKLIAYCLSMVDKKIQVEKEKKTQLQSLFNSMLHHLMTGKVRVNDLDLELPEEASK